LAGFWRQAKNSGQIVVEIDGKPSRVAVSRREREASASGRIAGAASIRRSAPFDVSIELLPGRPSSSPPAVSASAVEFRFATSLPTGRYAACPPIHALLTSSRASSRTKSAR